MAHPGVTQLWYAGDAGVGGTFGGIWQHLDDFMMRGPLHSYFLDLTKSILVVSLRNVPWSEAFFRDYGLQIVTGIRYIGGFVWSKAAQDLWLG